MKKLFLALMVACGLVSAAMAADVAFSSYDEDKIPTSYQWSIIDGGARLGTSTDMGAQFTSKVSGTLSSITVSIVRKSYSLNPDKPRTWVLASDVGGKPGNSIDVFNTVPPASVKNITIASTLKPTLVEGKKYWLLCPRDGTSGNVDGWVCSDLQHSQVIYAKWPMVYRQKDATNWVAYSGAVPAFKVAVSTVVTPPVVTPPVVTPPVVTPPVVTPPVVTPPVVTPPVVTPPVPETVEMLKSELNEIIKSLEDIAEKLRKLNE